MWLISKWLFSQHCSPTSQIPLAPADDRCFWSKNTKTGVKSSQYLIVYALFLFFFHFKGCSYNNLKYKLHRNCHHWWKRHTIKNNAKTHCMESEFSFSLYTAINHSLFPVFNNIQWVLLSHYFLLVQWPIFPTGIIKVTSNLNKLFDS